MKQKITLEFDDQIDALRCGFRVGWMTGTRGKGKKQVSVDLSCGAGLGTPWLIFSKKTSAGTKYLVADIRTLIPQLDKLA